MPERLVAAFDFGGTKLSAAIVDSRGSVLHRIKQPVRKASVADSVAQVAEVFHEFAGWAPAETRMVSGIGVCVPGIYFPSTGNAWAPNLWGWDQVPLRDALAAVLPSPVTIDSDRAAYVLGEQWLGVAKDLSDVIFVAVGTGIGAGIITGGRLCRGAADISGAIGWFALDPRKRDIYKQTGCFEAEAAGPGVAHRAAARLAAGEQSLIRSLAGGSPLTAEHVVSAARQKDPLALDVLHETASWLAMGIANLVSVLNPQMIVLGGGLMQAGNLLLEPLRREVLDWAQPIAARQVRIELSLLGEDAGLLGAARLPFLGGAS